MGSPIRTPVSHLDERAAARDASWRIVMAAARGAERLALANEPAVCALDADGELRPVAADDADAVIAWRPGSGWAPVLRDDDPRRALIDLYLPICSATAAHPIAIGHLGQSLDGFIATHAGESQWVTGEENILHLHRLRALCHAVVVGAGTIAADDPLLTTRLVPGPNPLRVVLDPARRLGAHHKVFQDNTADTLYMCARSLMRPGERQFGSATIVGVDGSAEGIAPADVLRLLHARGCTRVFVEGGGVTVSMFLEANLLDRLHVAIAPLFIGDGRPAIRLAPRAALGDCHRPRYRVFRMGGDVLFDCEVGTDASEVAGADIPALARII
jgi:diaminohydroxyphosphoribosylaminopyrimidine deaminase/5-amino-6-(5-phosphoribosylamino)uracil reductase